MPTNVRDTNPPTLVRKTTAAPVTASKTGSPSPPHSLAQAADIFGLS
jgi:hypothetical protein